MDFRKAEVDSNNWVVARLATRHPDRKALLFYPRLLTYMAMQIYSVSERKAR
jgi:hypothetical protein